MKLLLQRVSEASIRVDGSIIGEIGRGLLVFVAFEKGDTRQVMEKLGAKLLAYRIFSDKSDRMNLNVQQVAGALLVVSQFTLAANTKKGLRPSFTPAAEPAEGLRLYSEFVDWLSQQNIQLATGQYGADMKVSLTNDGPVTFLLDSQ